jgi:hypothetical protein
MDRQDSVSDTKYDSIMWIKYLEVLKTDLTT